MALTQELATSGQLLPPIQFLIKSEEFFPVGWVAELLVGVGYDFLPFLLSFGKWNQRFDYSLCEKP